MQKQVTDVARRLGPPNQFPSCAVFYSLFLFIGQSALFWSDLTQEPVNSAKLCPPCSTSSECAPGDTTTADFR